MEHAPVQRPATVPRVSNDSTPHNAAQGARRPKSTGALPERTVATARRVLESHARTFSLAGRFLDPEQLNDAAVCYAFCRTVDDAVDEAQDEASARAAIAALRRALRRAPRLGHDHASDPADDGDHERDEIIAAFDIVMDRCAIDPRAAESLIRGCEQDIERVRLPDDRALLRYCYRVAGVVGLMACGFLDVRSPMAPPFAIDLGIGMQLTNICRDVLEDARRDRCYLPATRLRSVGLDSDAVVSALKSEDPSPSIRRGVRSVVRDLLDLADDYYASGNTGLRYIPGRARVAIAAASWMYRAIGDRLRARDCAVWEGRTVVPPWQKLRALVVGQGAMLANALVSKPRHDASLHRHLDGLAGAAPPSAPHVAHPNRAGSHAPNV